jgi:hypothetical protein
MTGAQTFPSLQCVNYDGKTIMSLVSLVNAARPRLVGDENDPVKIKASKQGLCL